MRSYVQLRASMRICRAFLIFLTLVLFIWSAVAEEKDPHRPPCKAVACRKIKAFLKSHYCGKSPFGNGPDDGCEISWKRQTRPDVKWLASFNCEWNEKKQSSECSQQGKPALGIRALVKNELQLNTEMDKETHFNILQSSSPAWTVVEASYGYVNGNKATDCELIGIVDSGLHLHVLRKLPCQQTDADVPTTTSWSLLDVADVDGDGKREVVLEVDAYEHHWFEVISVGDDFSSRTIFSGLGYYL